MGQYFVCVDIGTAGTKAAILDCDGNELVRAFEESMLYYPKPGWVEENPENFYSSSINTIKQTVKQSKIDPNDILELVLQDKCQASSRSIKIGNQ